MFAVFCSVDYLMRIEDSGLFDYIKLDASRLGLWHTKAVEQQDLESFEHDDKLSRDIEASGGREERVQGRM